VVVAAFLSPTMFGFWFPGRHLVAALPCAAALAAWGLRHVPRWVGVALVALTLVASAWLYGALRAGATTWVAPTSRAPWGPLEAAFPHYGTASPYPSVVTAVVVAGLLLVAAREWWRWQERTRVWRAHP
jgi:hypothetical protein